jgi:hypothetical protein
MLHLDNPDAQNIEYCARYLKKKCVRCTSINASVPRPAPPRLLTRPDRAYPICSGEYLWMIVKGRREGEGTNGAGGAGQASYVLAVGRVLELRNTHGYEAYGMSVQCMPPGCCRPARLLCRDPRSLASGCTHRRV